LDPESLIEFLLWLLALAGGALASALEAVWPSIWRLQLEREENQDLSVSQLLKGYRHHFERYSTTLDIINLGVYVTAAILGVLWVESFIPSIGWVGALLLTLGLLLLCSRFSKEWARHRASALAPWFAPLLNGLSLLLSPIVVSLLRLERLVSSEGDDSGSLGWEFLLQQGDKMPFGKEERELITSIFEFGETIAREIMVPRIDIVAIREGSSVAEALATIVKSGHSRIPVYRGTIDNIVGILYAKDILKYLQEGQQEDHIDAFLRPPYFVPETKRVSELLKEMQRDKVHMAIVVDEYGGTAGLVTIEDILEEIVGEIQDEYDVEEPLVERTGEKEWIMDARVSLDDLEEILGFEVDEEGIDTLGGLIYSRLGRVPAVGDKVILGDCRIIVLSVAGRRIKKVKIVKGSPQVVGSLEEGAVAHLGKQALDDPSLTAG